MTKGIRVRVRRPSTHRGAIRPHIAHRYVFAYTVRIENERPSPRSSARAAGSSPTGAGKVEEVRGPGNVVGQTPYLRPGQHF